MPDIYFKNENITIQIKEGTTLLQAARKAGVLIESPCDAVGTCGKCKVKIVDGRENLKSIGTHHHLTKEQTKEGYVLSCQVEAYGNVTVLTQGNAALNHTLKIVSEGQSFAFDIISSITKKYDGEKTLVYSDDKVLGSEPGDTTADAYGLVIDIGTTTLVVALVDLITGEELASESSLNPQSLQAQDVLTRIHIASEEEGLSSLYHVVTEEFNHLIDLVTEKSGVNREYIYEAVYSGNTAMLHLACNVNPKALGQYPYTPTITGGNRIAAAKHLHISPYGFIYLPPIISAYVGPDITSGVIASRLDRAKGTTLFIDIGTNGEMVMAKDGRLYATSTAAGPAFEGMNITYGCRAGNGAIETFEIDDEMKPRVGVIGEVEATGICGSGLLDIVGELVRVGVISNSGRFIQAGENDRVKPLERYLKQWEGKPCFEIRGQVLITQKDIRQVQLAKGAIRAGIEALLKYMDIDAKDVDVVEIAGSFGYHLKESSLLNIGLLPREFAGKVKFVGNTSKSGGKALLLNARIREEAANTVKEITVVELSKSEGFEKLFVGAMNFA